MRLSLNGLQLFMQLKRIVDHAHAGRRWYVQHKVILLVVTATPAVIQPSPIISTKFDTSYLSTDSYKCIVTHCCFEFPSPCTNALPHLTPVPLHAPTAPPLVALCSQALAQSGPQPDQQQQQLSHAKARWRNALSDGRILSVSGAEAAFMAEEDGWVLLDVRPPGVCVGD